jgi:vacuolar-type H+-ATPase subunit B/Vma2
MAEIKPAEISAILKKQVEGFESGATLEEVGSVLNVGDGIARVYGLSNVQYGELVEFENGLEGIVLNLEEDNVGVVLLGPSTGIKEGSTAKRTQRIASLKAGEQMVGRVVNTLGFPIDGKGPIGGDLYEMPLERKAPGVIFRQPVTEPLQTGVKAVDAMIPVMRAQFGNPSSIHSYGREVRSALESARKKVAQLLKTSPSEIFFTSGGTEANNMAIRCSMHDLNLKHAITSTLEHHAVLHTLEDLAHAGTIKLSLVKIFR